MRKKIRNANTYFIYGGNLKNVVQQNKQQFALNFLKKEREKVKKNYICGVKNITLC